MFVMLAYSKAGTGRVHPNGHISTGSDRQPALLTHGASSVASKLV